MKSTLNPKLKGLMAEATNPNKEEGAQTQPQDVYQKSTGMQQFPDCNFEAAGGTHRTDFRRN